MFMDIKEILVNVFTIPAIIVIWRILYWFALRLIRRIKGISCNIPVEATCVKILEDYSGNDTYTYGPEFEFQYLGETRRIQPSAYSNPTPYRVGDKFTLLIDADAMSYILSEESLQKLKELKRERYRANRMIVRALLFVVWLAFNFNTINEIEHLIVVMIKGQ
jgi:hypothetical protein